MRREDYLFSEGDTSASLDRHAQEVEEKIKTLTDEAIRQRSESDVAADLVNDELVRPLVLNEQSVEKHVDEVQIEAPADRYFQSGPGRRLTQGYKFTCEYFFSGDAVLWKLRPKQWSSVLPRAMVHAEHGGRDGKLIVTTTAPGNPQPEDLLAGIESELRTIRQYIEWQTPQVNEFNKRLEQRIRAAVTKRFSQLESAKGLASALGAVIKSESKSPYPSTVPSRSSTPQASRANAKKPHDVFISHASEDKEAIVRPLANALRAKGVEVWLDETELSLGDSLRRTIDRGLSASRFGLVVLSPRFFEKSWPQYELDGLVTREMQGQKVILPVWHEVSYHDVATYSPTLADKLAADTSKHSVDEIADQVTRALKKL
jgi:hypothetical protein